MFFPFNKIDWEIIFLDGAFWASKDRGSLLPAASPHCAVGFSLASGVMSLLALFHRLFRLPRFLCFPTKFSILFY